MSPAEHTRSVFTAHISAHTWSSKFLWDLLEHSAIVMSRVIKELKLPLCSFTGDVVRQTNKGSERRTLLFGVNYILYSISPKRRSFVARHWANCRAWWIYCAMPQQSCQGEIQLPSAHTNTGRKRSNQHWGGRYDPVWKPREERH